MSEPGAIVNQLAAAGLLWALGRLWRLAGRPVDAEFEGRVSRPPLGGERDAVCTATALGHLGASLPEAVRQISGQSMTQLILSVRRGAVRNEPLEAGVDPEAASALREALRLSHGLTAEQWESWQTEPEPKLSRQSTLAPIFATLDNRSPEASAQEIALRLPARPLEPEALFPAAPEPDPQWGDLLSRLESGLEQMAHIDEPAHWLEELDMLLMRVAGNVPGPAFDRPPGSGQSTCETESDVPLYDFARSVGALAPALYLSSRNQPAKEGTQASLKFITGQFLGIQRFMFTQRGTAAKFRSKLLRGRSVLVSLLTELAAARLLEHLGLPPTSLLFNAAGKFTVVAPGLEWVQGKVEECERELAEWLIAMSCGETAIRFSATAVDPSALAQRRLGAAWQEIQEQAEERRCQQIDFGSIDDVIFEIEGDAVCRLCGVRGGIEWRPQPDEEAVTTCLYCQDQVELGTRIIKKNHLRIVESGAGALKKRLFGRYQLDFFEKPPRSGRCLRQWVLCDPAQELPQAGSLRFFRPYAPVIEQGEGAEKHIGQLKSFEDIAAKAVQVESVETDEDGRKVTRGLEMLGVLKADVDHLGILMACGLPPERHTLPRLHALSRQLHLLFALWLPRHLQGSDVYTVFAGGDDLMLIGPWNEMRRRAQDIADHLARFAAGNEMVHLSAGITLHRPGETVARMARAAEHALESSKRERNRLTVFGETVPWAELPELMGCSRNFQKWLDEDWLGTGLLHRFNHFITQSEAAQSLGTEVSAGELDCLKWRAHLAYQITRNVGRGLDGDARRSAREEVAQTANWLAAYAGRLRIPLWEVLYQRRERRP